MTDGNNNASSKLNFKEKIETIQAIVTIVALFVGALWTYILFVKERQQFPHAIIEHSISHVPLSQNTNLLRVAITLSNTGTARLLSGMSVIRVQQILPLPPCPRQGPCAKEEVDTATKEIVRKENRFTWPVLSERVNIPKYLLDIEPGEKDFVDFEFAVSNEVRVVRVYSYFRNDNRSSAEAQIGWTIASYYDFRNSKSRGGQ